MHIFGNTTLRWQTEQLFLKLRTTDITLSCIESYSFPHVRVRTASTLEIIFLDSMVIYDTHLLLFMQISNKMVSSKQSAEVVLFLTLLVLVVSSAIPKAEDGDKEPHSRTPKVWNTRILSICGNLIKFVVSVWTTSLLIVNVLSPIGRFVGSQRQTALRRGRTSQFWIRPWSISWRRIQKLWWSFARGESKAIGVSKK